MESGESLLYCTPRRGHQVTITGRREPLMAEVVARNPGNLSSICLDVRDEVRCDELMHRFSEQKNPWDLIIYSAGCGELNEELEFGLEEGTIELNVRAFTRIACWAYRYFSEKGKGHFATISSVAGLRGNRIAPAYNASKAYQINYLEGLRQKSRHDGGRITITDIRPGSVKTDMMKGEGHFWIATPERAAAQIKRAIERKCRYCYITGKWRIVAGILKRLPSFFYERM